MHSQISIGSAARLRLASPRAPGLIFEMIAVTNYCEWILRQLHSYCTPIKLEPTSETVRRPEPRVRNYCTARATSIKREPTLLLKTPGVGGLGSPQVESNTP